MVLEKAALAHTKADVEGLDCAPREQGSDIPGTLRARAPRNILPNIPNRILSSHPSRDYI